MLTALGNVADLEPGVHMDYGESDEFDVIFIVRQPPTEPIVFPITLNAIEYDVVIATKPEPPEE
jgi:hypothetical protein